MDREWEKAREERLSSMIINILLPSRVISSGKFALDLHMHTSQQWKKSNSLAAELQAESELRFLQAPHP